MPTYTTEDGVYGTTGFTSEILRRVTELPEAEVTSLVNDLIDNAEADLKEDINVPFVIRKELHLGTGYDNQFALGPYDEDFATMADFDPEDGVESVMDVRFASYKRKRPYPTNCDIDGDLFTVLGWSGTATPLGNSDEEVHGTNCLKITYAGAGEYIQYPDGANTSYLDKQIGPYSYVFFYIKSNAIVTFTLRLYDTDGNYTEQTFSPRQANIGQFFWLNLAAFTGSIAWTSSGTRFQYFRIYASGACIAYLDNFCFTDEWAYSAPSGILHVAKADNVTGSGYPSETYPYYVTYSYDPFLASTPRHIKEATEWLTGVKIIDHLRGHKYGTTDFWLEGDTMEPDTPMQKSGMLGLRTKFLDNYKRCTTRYGGGSYGVV